MGDWEWEEGERGREIPLESWSFNCVTHTGPQRDRGHPQVTLIPALEVFGLQLPNNSPGPIPILGQTELGAGMHSIKIQGC
jgi:hypothetical protein